MKKNKSTVRFFLAQVNTSVGDIRGNAGKIMDKIKEASLKRADIVIFPELSVTGYPPEDLLLKNRFSEDNLKALESIASSAGDIIAVVGFTGYKAGKKYNSAAVISRGKIRAVYDKINLPNYGVFDENRYFTAGKKAIIFSAGGLNFGVSICEDLWQETPELEKMAGSLDFYLNISASPYHMGKWKERLALFKSRARQFNANLIYCNMIGGQDELIFDGHSLIIDKKGRLLCQGKQFEEDDIIYDFEVKSKVKSHPPSPGLRRTSRSKVKIDYTLKEKNEVMKGANNPPLSLEEEIYEALKLGTKDYVTKNGFKKVVLGLSGGVDSALVAVIAADALGKENVNLIFMPSKFSSKESLDDAKKLSDNLGIKLKIIGIQELFDLFMEKLAPEFKGMEPDTAEENLQARLRGNINMAFSNKFNWLVLTTGNKSEMSTGYATLYGDMAGGFAVIKDVPKMVVYSLVKMRNLKAGFDLIPENIITKPPTAELRFNQKDTDSLPEYSTLDKIIEDYIEDDKTYGELKGKYDDATLRKVIRMIDINEYKRRQAPPGVKITPKAFGRDRRMPITNKYRE